MVWLAEPSENHSQHFGNILKALELLPKGTESQVRVVIYTVSVKYVYPSKIMQWIFSLYCWYLYQKRFRVLSTRTKYLFTALFSV